MVDLSSPLLILATAAYQAATLAALTKINQKIYTRALAGHFDAPIDFAPSSIPKSVINILEQSGYKLKVPNPNVLLVEWSTVPNSALEAITKDKNELPTKFVTQRVFFSNNGYQPCRYVCKEKQGSNGVTCKRHGDEIINDPKRSKLEKLIVNLVNDKGIAPPMTTATPTTTSPEM